MSYQNVTGPSVNSFTLDADTILKDAGAVTATGVGQVGGSDRILDFGGVSPGPGVENVAYTPAKLVVDVAAFDFATGDEVAHVLFLLSDNASGGGSGFAAGDRVVAKAGLIFGDVATVFNVSNMDDNGAAPTGRYVIGVDNEFQGAFFRFVRIAHVLSGTTPSINYTAYLARIS